MKTPFPVTYRELWLPQHINGTQLAPSAPGGHLLTLTGASKRTTADGVHFTGAATSNIVVAANADQNAQAAMHITIRFKLDTTFAAGAAGDFYLFRKITGTSEVRVYLDNADGKLKFEQYAAVGGALVFSLTSTTVSWTAGTWYTVTVSLTGTGPAERLLVNGTAEDTDTVAPETTPGGGDMVIGSSSDGGTDGVVGTISRVVIGVGAHATVTLTAAQETDLNKGVPPPTAKVQYMYLMDEGQGTTVNNRGDGAGGGGTLDSACTWRFGQVRAPLLSLDAINDVAVTGATVNLHGDWTLYTVIKAQTTYNGPSKVNYGPTSIGPDTADYAGWLIGGANSYLLGLVAIASTQTSVSLGAGLTIGNYYVLALTFTEAGVVAVYNNGALVGSSSGAAKITATPAIASLGRWANQNYDPSGHLQDSFVETAHTAAQVKAYSRYLRDKFNLPITI